MQTPEASALLLGEPVSKPGDGLTFRRLAASDLFDLEPQPSQSTWLGIETASLSIDAAQAHADGPNSWTAWCDGKPLACLGVAETFTGRQGIAWALLGVGLGRQHLGLTRFARDVVVGESPLVRIETYARCAVPPFNTGSQLELASYALQHATPEVRWAIDVGFLPVAVLRKMGAASEPHMLLERVS